MPRSSPRLLKSLSFKAYHISISALLPSHPCHPNFSHICANRSVGQPKLGLGRRPPGLPSARSFAPLLITEFSLSHSHPTAASWCLGQAMGYCSSGTRRREMRSASLSVAMNTWSGPSRSPQTACKSLLARKNKRSGSGT